MDALIQFFYYQKLAVFALLTFGAGCLAIIISSSSKASILSIFQITASNSSQAKTNRKRLSSVGFFSIILSFLLCGVSLFGESIESFFEDRKQPLSYSKPIITNLEIPRTCIASSCHEKKNYGLLVDVFAQKSNAKEVQKKLSNLKCRKAEYFRYKCEDENNLKGDYLLFVERRFNTFESANEKELEYERILSEKGFKVDLQIATFTD